MNPPAIPDWNAAAAALHAAFPVARWPERVRGRLEAEARAEEPWCVALSGGADSVALLLVLAGLRNADRGMRIDQTGNRRPDTEPAIREPALLKSERGTQCALPSPAPEFCHLPSAIRHLAAPIVALHFNHRLRGAAADADEAFCRELCAALGVELRVGAATWPAGSEVSEAQAREARFAFFARAMRECSARALWLGHQRDDVVETMLLRLSRGSAARGLAAPRPVQRLADGTVRLRPLLEVSKAEVVAALRAAGVPWCEDATNHGEAYFRNRLRHRVLPAWREAAPADLSAAVARSRELLEEEDEALELWTDRVLAAALGEVLPLAELRGAPVAITRRAVHRWLGAQGLGGVLSRAAFDEVLAAVRAGRATRLSAGAAGFLESDGASLRVVVPDAEPCEWGALPLPIPGETALAGGARLVARVVALDAALLARIRAGQHDDGRTAFLGALETAGVFSIRPWRAGDRYRPLGASGTQKLQDQFVNRRVPRGLRRLLPVVCGPDGAILWVPGLPPAHDVRLHEGTSVAVQLTYLPATSLSASTGHV